MELRRGAGLAFGYGLLTIALLAVVSALRVVTMAALGTIVVTNAVFFVMTSLGAALVVGVGGYVALQRVSRIGTGYGVNLDWGRVLGR